MTSITPVIPDKTIGISKIFLLPTVGVLLAIFFSGLIKVEIANKVPSSKNNPILPTSKSPIDSSKVILNIKVLSSTIWYWMKEESPSQTKSVTSVIVESGIIIELPIFTPVTLTRGPLIPAWIQAAIPASVITVFIKISNQYVIFIYK